MNENIALFTSQLNSISNDIKRIQTSIKDANVPLEIRHFCKNEIKSIGFGGFEAYGFDKGIQITKYLVWNVYQNNGDQSDWYLLYEETEQAVDIVLEKINQTFSTTTKVIPTGATITKIRKPLIECKAPIRIEMYAFLQSFIEEVSKKLKLDDFKVMQNGVHKAMQQL